MVEKRTYHNDWEKTYKEYNPKELPWYLDDLDPDLELELAKRNISSGNFLDIGTGVGTQAKALAEKGFQVIGVDISTNALEFAKKETKKLNNLRFMQDDITNTRLIQKFDYIFDRGCFHTLFPEFRKEYIKNILKLLNENGLLFIKTFSIEEPGNYGPQRLSENEILAIIVITIAISAYYYPKLSDNLPSHWNSEGIVDGYMAKNMGIAFVPLIMILFSSMTFWVPKLDPKIENFRNYFDGFIIILMLFFLFIHLQIILWDLGIQISPNKSFPIALGILMIYVGFLLSKSSRNWFIGIRTPWTLQSDYVWEKTHKIGSKLFIAVGIISMIGIFFGKFAIYFLLIPVFAAVLITFFYSYYLFKQEQKNSK